MDGSDSKGSKPRQARGATLKPMSQPGYYPGYSTLAQQKFWDAKTREVVLRRVNDVPQVRFFNVEEAKLVAVIADHLIPQEDRIPERRIPILPRIDDRLYKNKHDGYRYEDMPSDREAYRLGLHGIEECARHVYSKSFLELTYRQQEEILRSLHDNQPAAGHEIWRRMSLHHFWLMLVGHCVEAYYSHPWAWDEIGFGGPAYPRGYMRLERGDSEPWEKDERRYDWEAPEDALSDIFEPIPSAIETHPRDRERRRG